MIAVDRLVFCLFIFPPLHGNCSFYYCFAFYLQNPKNCGAAKVLICKPLTSCGFACSIHHLSYCFMVAYQLERTLVIENVMWEYQEKFSDLFLPISSTCLKATKKGILWAGKSTSILFLNCNENLENAAWYFVLLTDSLASHNTNASIYLLKKRKYLKLRYVYGNLVLCICIQYPNADVYDGKEFKVFLHVSLPKTKFNPFLFFYTLFTEIPCLAKHSLHF